MSMLLIFTNTDIMALSILLIALGSILSMFEIGGKMTKRVK